MDMKLNNLGTETWFVDVDIRAGRFTWNVERDAWYVMWYVDLGRGT